MSNKQYLNKFGTQQIIDWVKRFFVQKDGDKQLSDNNYTTNEKVKLESVSQNAEVNKIDTISVNGLNQPAVNKKVDIAVPTQTSALINDSGYQTKEEVDEAVKKAFDLKAEIVETLPGDPKSGVTYFLKSKDGKGNNQFTEYLFINGEWEKIGQPEINFDDSNYVKTTDYITTQELNEMLAL